MNTEKSLNHYLSRVYRKSMLYLQHKVDQEEIGLGQIICLNEIYKQEGLNQEHLATNLSVDKATIARAIKHLEKNGYIYRQRNENDKRAYEIYLTEKGKAEYNNIYEFFDELEAILSANLTDLEKNILINLLEKVCSHPDMN
ncbi:MAG: hypothetical protein ATN35_02215 [Epulopiscium sp. Nele67-Bin004]|nr:MAG: hypothetical protein ATN35_02215 [Epulopiscium sp. Nele67-Bin004]